MLANNTQKHLTVCKQMIDIKYDYQIEPLVLDNDTWMYLTECKQMIYSK